jgi:hypothetical protein
MASRHWPGPATTECNWSLLSVPHGDSRRLAKASGHGSDVYGIAACAVTVRWGELMDMSSAFDGHFPDHDQPDMTPHGDLTPADESHHLDGLITDHGGTFGLDADPASELAVSGLAGNHFVPGQSGHVVGSPEVDMQYWHHQTFDNTCAVVAQESVLESLTGQHFSETSLRDEALARGWYTESGGTPVDDVGALLALHGIPVQQESGATLQDIENQLAAGHKVIVGVNGEDIWNDAHPDGGSLPVGAYPGIPGQVADHAVEVIGVDTSDPAQPKVILNDSGTPDGRGLEVPADVFQEAWSASGDFMVHTGSPTSPGGTMGTPGAISGGGAGINEDAGDSVEVWGEHYSETRAWTRSPRNS